MNVTKHVLKGRQLHNEGCLGMVPAEQGEYPKASNHERITENNDFIMDMQTGGLLERILDRDNMNNAYLRVKSNKGVGGVDKMSVDELLPYLKENKDKLLEQLRLGKYKPQPVRRVEIPKEEKGKVRKLGIPTVVDRVIQQAIMQVLTPIYESQFSDNSYGFRPNRGAHDALRKCQEHADEGYCYVVDMDLEKFFDTVSQSKLMEVLSKSINDGRVMSLINKYLNAGIVQHGVFERSEKGVPQGGPLSPLLSNVMLNELDKELEKRGHRFVRYADDCMILCKSRKSAERTMLSITKFIERKLFLKVNKEKTVVARINKVKFLGYGFYIYKGKCRLKLHFKSKVKMKSKIREILNRNKGISNEARRRNYMQFIKGWLQYFKLADMKGILRDIDGWIRRRIRAVYWKQWKKIKTRYRMIRRYNIPEWKVHELANCRRGPWRAALMLNQIFSDKEIASQGYMPMTSYYLHICEN